MPMSPERARELQALGAAARRANRAKRDAAAELARSTNLLDQLETTALRLEDLTNAQQDVVRALLRAAEGQAER